MYKLDTSVDNNNQIIMIDRINPIVHGYYKLFKPPRFRAIHGTTDLRKCKLYVHVFPTAASGYRDTAVSCSMTAANLLGVICSFQRLTAQQIPSTVAPSRLYPVHCIAVLCVSFRSRRPPSNDQVRVSPRPDISDIVGRSEYGCLVARRCPVKP